MIKHRCDREINLRNRTQNRTTRMMNNEQLNMQAISNCIHTTAERRKNCHDGFLNFRRFNSRVITLNYNVTVYSVHICILSDISVLLNNILSGPRYRKNWNIDAYSSRHQRTGTMRSELRTGSSTQHLVYWLHFSQWKGGYSRFTTSRVGAPVSHSRSVLGYRLSPFASHKFCWTESI